MGCPLGFFVILLLSFALFVSFFSLFVYVVQFIFIITICLFLFCLQFRLLSVVGGPIVLFYIVLLLLL